MPSVTRQQPESFSQSSAKKRRRQDAEGEVQMPFTVTTHLDESQDLLPATSNHERPTHSSTSRGPPASTTFNLPRKIVPMLSNKRFRLDVDGSPNNISTHIQHLSCHDHIPSPDASQHQHPYPYAHCHQHSHQNHHHQPRQDDSFSHAHAHPHPTPPLSPQARPNASRINSSSALLSPCHICHRKPTKKSDLDSFADCMGCAERTCFICIRACQGWLSSFGDNAYVEQQHHQQQQQTHPTEDEDLSASFTMRDVDGDEEEEQEEEDHNSYRMATSAKGRPRREDERTRVGDTGWWAGRGHRAVICSRCCVERGSEGDVVCLGCLDGMEGA